MNHSKTCLLGGRTQQAAADHRIRMNRMRIWDQLRFFKCKGSALEITCSTIVVQLPEHDLELRIQLASTLGFIADGQDFRVGDLVFRDGSASALDKEVGGLEHASKMKRSLSRVVGRQVIAGVCLSSRRSATCSSWDCCFSRFGEHYPRLFA